MALTAAQVEQLSMKIGDLFGFDDLDLVMWKCFGQREINSIAARTEPNRAAARKCIDRVEKTGRTETFARFVVESPLSDVQLRNDLITIFPVLAQATPAFAGIVAGAVTGLNAISSQMTGAVAGDTIDSLKRSIDELGIYKRLHEAVHQIQIFEPPETPSDKPELISEPPFRNAVRQYATLLQTSSIAASGVLTPFPHIEHTELPWIQKLDECAQRMLDGLRQNDFAAVALAFMVVARRIGPTSGEIDERIARIARDLQIPQLSAALKAALGTTNGASADLNTSLGALDALGAALLAQVVEHNAWQAAEDGLYALDQTFKSAAAALFAEFALYWPGTRRQLQALAKSQQNGDWSASILGDAEKVDQALAGIATAREALTASQIATTLSDPYADIRQKARMRFFRVDAALKQSCQELVGIQASLGKIPRRTSP